MVARCSTGSIASSAKLAEKLHAALETARIDRLARHTVVQQARYAEATFRAAFSEDPHDLARIHSFAW